MTSEIYIWSSSSRRPLYNLCNFYSLCIRQKWLEYLIIQGRQEFRRSQVRPTLAILIIQRSLTIAENIPIQNDRLSNIINLVDYWTILNPRTEMHIQLQLCNTCIRLKNRIKSPLYFIIIVNMAYLDLI